MSTFNYIEMGKRIKNRRKEKGYTQPVLAEKMGVSDRTIKDWEKGKLDGKVNMSNLLELFSILDIDMNYLLGNDYSTVKVQKMCEYTGLTEEAIKRLHYSQDSAFSLSHIINEYNNDFDYLIFEIKEYLINSVIEQKAKESIKKNPKSPLALFTMPEQEASSIHLLNCLRILERMSQTASKDKEIVEHLKDSSLFADMFDEK